MARCETVRLDQRFCRLALTGVFAAVLAAEVSGGERQAGRHASERPPATNPPLTGLSLLDVDGVAHHLGARPGRRGVAIVFLSTECPIANSFIPELNRISHETREKASGVELLGVISGGTTSFAAARKHAAEFQMAFPVLVDATGDLAQALAPTHIPEAFVFDQAGRLVYRGRIDDTYVDLGKRRLAATTHELRDAIEAVRSGSKFETPRTPPVGCLFEAKSAGALGTKVTYSKHIAPILQTQCMSCHREGEVAPFSLTSYNDAAKRANLLSQVADSRLMPPWRAEPGFGHFVDERRLTDNQLDILRAWAEAGAPEGDPAELPPAPKFVDGWQLGEPDLVVTVPEAFDVPADGRDVFRNFVIPLDVAENKLVSAVEFRPGNRRVVHHALFFLDSTGQARKKDAADPGPGYGTFGGPGFLPTGALGGWAPGQVPPMLADGAGRRLQRGSDLVLQVHYHPTGKPETDRSTIGIHFVKQPSQKVVAGMIVLDRRLSIPAGAANHPMSASYTLPADVTLLGITPHMHLLGREMKVTATSPDGVVEPLIWIKDWNFNWQDQYLFAQPLKLPKGTRIDVAGLYDNSAANPLNPNSPPRDVSWGEQTTDEMFICFLLGMTDNPNDLVPLVIDNLSEAARKRSGRRPGLLRQGLGGAGK